LQNIFYCGQIEPKNKVSPFEIRGDLDN